MHGIYTIKAAKWLHHKNTYIEYPNYVHYIESLQLIDQFAIKMIIFICEIFCITLVFALLKNSGSTNHPMTLFAGDF